MPERSPSKNRAASGSRPWFSSTSRSSASRRRATSVSTSARLAQRQRGRVDRQRGLVTEQMARHRGDDERERRMHRRHRDGLDRRAQPRLAVGRDHDRRGLVRAVDRELLADVVGVGAGEPGRADEDQRLGREVDVLLVLGRVAGDRLVAELRELDPQLLRGDAVDAVADERPRPPVRRVTVLRPRRSPAGARRPCASRRAARAARPGAPASPGSAITPGETSSAIRGASRHPAAIWE